MSKTTKAMMNDSIFIESAVGILGYKMFCDGQKVKGLSRAQRAAMHRFAHAVMASGYELYEKVEKEKADPLIADVIRAVLEELSKPEPMKVSKAKP